MPRGRSATSIRSDSSDMDVDGIADTEMVKLQRQFRIMEGDRQAYSIQSQELIRKQRTQEEDMVTRIRLGHTGLNSTLFTMKKHIDGNCRERNIQETTEHVIKSCTKYQWERQELLGCLNAPKA